MESKLAVAVILNFLFHNQSCRHSNQLFTTYKIYAFPKKQRKKKKDFLKYLLVSLHPNSKKPSIQSPKKT